MLSLTMVKKRHLEQSGSPRFSLCQRTCKGTVGPLVSSSGLRVLSGLMAGMINSRDRQRRAAVRVFHNCTEVPCKSLCLAYLYDPYSQLAI